MCVTKSFDVTNIDVMVRWLALGHNTACHCTTITCIYCIALAPVGACCSRSQLKLALSYITRYRVQYLLCDLHSKCAISTTNFNTILKWYTSHEYDDWNSDQPTIAVLLCSWNKVGMFMHTEKTKLWIYVYFWQSWNTSTSFAICNELCRCDTFRCYAPETKLECLGPPEKRSGSPVYFERPWDTWAFYANYSKYCCCDSFMRMLWLYSGKIDEDLRSAFNEEGFDIDAIENAGIEDAITDEHVGIIKLEDFASLTQEFFDEFLANPLLKLSIVVKSKLTRVWKKQQVQRLSFCACWFGSVECPTVQNQKYHFSLCGLVAAKQKCQTG